MLTVAFAAIAIAIVALSALELWAYAQKRFDLSARVLTAELPLGVALVALSVVDRSWWLAAVWVGCVALTAWNLRRTNRRREAHTA